MKVTKDMVHPDLQKSFGGLSAFTFMSKRTWFRNFTSYLGNKMLAGMNIDGLKCEERFVDSSDGTCRIRTRIYRPSEVDNSEKLPAFLYIHGGGYITGNPESAHAVIERFIETRPCVVVAPDYRKAGTKPFPAGFNDCYDILLWIKANAAELGVRDDQFIVGGHSAGGGLTAAVTLKARDTGDVQVAFQLPIYPMIDDQQPADATREIATPVWDTDMNTIGWNAYLADLHSSGSEIPAYAAPARNTDYTNFPPTITFVGSLEPFYRETQDYVAALKAADIEVAYKEYPGCFHAFDFFGTPISEDAQSFTYDSYADFYDRYL